MQTKGGSGALAKVDDVCCGATVNCKYYLATYLGSYAKFRQPHNNKYMELPIGLLALLQAFGEASQPEFVGRKVTIPNGFVRMRLKSATFLSLNFD